jgi:hypothetical protein
MQFCKIKNGQVVTEFVLALPWVCAALLVFVMFVLFLVRSQQVIYAGFMADRVAMVWPKDPVKMANLELNKLLKGFDVTYEIISENSSINYATPSPFRFGIFDVWQFKTESLLAMQPSSACEGEDNPLPFAIPEECL